MALTRCGERGGAVQAIKITAGQMGSPFASPRCALPVRWNEASCRRPKAAESAGSGPRGRAGGPPAAAAGKNGDGGRAGRPRACGPWEAGLEDRVHLRGPDAVDVNRPASSVEAVRGTRVTPNYRLQLLLRDWTAPDAVAGAKARVRRGDWREARGVKWCACAKDASCNARRVAEEWVCDAGMPGMPVDLVGRAPGDAFLELRVSGEGALT